MSTRPRFSSLDRMDVAELVDLVGARVALIPREQHDLMSGWGGPSQARSVYMQADDNTTNNYTISYRVPPGVTNVDVAVLVFGAGTVKLTTAADTTGTLFRSTDMLMQDSMQSAAVWLKSNGVYNGYGAESGRALGVASSPSWAWTDTDVSVEVVGASQTGDEMYVLGLVFVPIHVAR